VRPVARRVHNEHPVMVSAHISQITTLPGLLVPFFRWAVRCVRSLVARRPRSTHAPSVGKTSALCRCAHYAPNPCTPHRAVLSLMTLYGHPRVSRWFRIPIMPRRFSSSSKFSGKSAWNKTRARGHNDTIAIPGEQRVRAELEAVGAFDEDKIGRHIANPGKCALQPHAQLR
jgi:hypothetical protein